MMRFSPNWLLFHWLLVFGFTATDAKGLFKDCDGTDKMCFVRAACVEGGKEDTVGGGVEGSSTLADKDGSLIALAKKDVSRLSCRTGFELKQHSNVTWSISMARDVPTGSSDLTSLFLTATNKNTSTVLADCAKEIKEALYKTEVASSDAAKSLQSCSRKIVALESEAVVDALADVFHLSYGESVFCLKAEFADGHNEELCTAPVDFSLFNRECQSEERIGKECDESNQDCEMAEENKNVFSCRNSEKSVLVLDDTTAYEGSVRCTKDGWRWTNTSQRASGQLIGKGRRAPQCVSLLSRFVGNECAAPLGISNDSCSVFSPSSLESDNLQCLSLMGGAIVIYKGKGYTTINLDYETKGWYSGRTLLGPAHLGNPPPFCVFTCSDVFLSGDCGNKTACSKGVFTGKRSTNEGGEPIYSTRLQCPSPDDLLIINSRAHFGSELACDTGVWKMGKKEMFDVRKEFMKSGNKMDVRCHSGCDASLIRTNCSGDAGCRKPTKKDDGAIDCGSTHAIFASADDTAARASGSIKELLPEREFNELRCTREGWISEGATVLDFKQHPQNDIAIQCISKCSPRFTECEKEKNCPVRKADELSCANPDENLFLNGVPSLLDALRCDEQKGWLEPTTGKLLVDFSSAPFHVKVSCGSTCERDPLTPSSELVVAAYKEGKAHCTRAGTVMVFNDNIQYGQANCSRNSWILTNPAGSVPRATVDDRVKAYCYNKCDKKWVTPSACVAAGTCDMFEHDSLAFLHCANPKNFIVFEHATTGMVYESGNFACSLDAPLWTRGSGGRRTKVVEFNKVDVDVTVRAHCHRNCDQARIKDACEGEKNCRAANFEKDVLSCPIGFLLEVNGKIEWNAVNCEKAGFVRSNDEVILPFETTKPDATISAKCMTRCDHSFVKLHCDEMPCSKPTLDAAVLKCPDPRAILELRQPGGAPDAAVLAWGGEAACEEAAGGWVLPAASGGTLLIDLQGENLNVEATCRLPCDPAMVERVEGGRGKLAAYKSAGDPLKCTDANSRLFLNEVETGPLTCNSSGWSDVASHALLLKFTKENLKQKINTECKHKCDAHFIEPACTPEMSACRKAAYAKDKLSCESASEVLMIDGKELASDSMACSDKGWSANSTLIIDTSASTSFHIRAHCIELCDPSFITQRGSKPVAYSLDDKKLTCASDLEMLTTDGKPLYSDLTCDKDGWRNEEKQLVYPFHGETPQRQIEAGCETNDCLSRGFSLPCDNRTAEFMHGVTCTTPTHTAYTISCQYPLMLVANLDTMIHHDDARCRSGKWYDANEALIAETEETPMRLQCFAKKCVECKDTLESGCKADGGDATCLPRTFTSGTKNYCSRYECSSKWWRVSSNESATRFFTGVASCDVNGADYISGDGTPINGSLDCVSHVSCAVFSPLRTDCDGLLTNCTTNNVFNQTIEAATRPVECPATYQLYLETSPSEWSTASGLRCKEDGNWNITVVGAGGKKHQRTIEKGARVVCASSLPVPDPALLNTTTTPFVPISEDPCVECRKVADALECDECVPEGGDILFSSDGDKCIAKASKSAFYADDDQLVKGDLSCRRETEEDDKSLNVTVTPEGKFVWRTDAGAAVTKFAASKKEATVLPGVSSAKLAITIIAPFLILISLVGAIVLFIWFRRRRALNTEAGKTRGLEQKNDEILGDIVSDQPPMLKL